VRNVLKSYLEHLCGEEFVHEDKPLAELTNFRIGGPAKFFVRVQNKANLIRLVSALTFVEEDFFVIGGGFNILASDDGFDGVVINLDFAEILDNGTFIYADAGAKMDDVLEFAKERALSGLEWAIGLPGTVGGAVFMNAGAYGGEIKDVVVCVDVLTEGQVVNMDATKLKFSYRTSIFQKKKDWIILGAYFYLKNGKICEIVKKQEELFAKRLTSQPYHDASAGSTFRRPRPDFYVGTAIKELGLQGTSVGGAQVSTKHAGFIVNNGGATAADVEKLVRKIKRAVYTAYNERLQTEYVQLPSRRNKQSVQSDCPQNTGEELDL